MLKRNRFVPFYLTLFTDFYTGKKYKGGQTISIEVNKESIPTFVRSGSIIPMTKSLQHTKEYDGNTLEIHYYYDAESDNAELILYNDDGLTQDAYRKKEFEMLKFKIKNEESSITILCSADTGNNYETEQPRARFFPPGKLNLNRFETGFNFDFES